MVGGELRCPPPNNVSMKNEIRYTNLRLDHIP